MSCSLNTVRRRVAAGTLLVALGVGVSLGVPALADDEHSPGDSHEAVDRIADDGSIIPEPEPEPQAEDAISSRDELVAIEKAIDLEGSPAFFICADENATQYTVVAGHEAPEDAKVNPDAGPLIEEPDPCEGLDWVVGK